MNTHFLLVAMILLLLGFFSSSFYDSSITGAAVGEDTFKDNVDFMAWRTTMSQGRYGEGTFSVQLPKEPEYCELEGKWKVNHRVLKKLGRPIFHCDGAEGSFSGYIDKSVQYSVNDAGNFRWAGATEAAFDPAPERAEGYVLQMWTCDHLYYTDTGPRNYVKLWVENFGKQTDFQWEYLDDDRQPAVDVFFELSCKLKNPKTTVQKNKIVLPTSVAEEVHKEEPVVGEAFKADVDEFEPKSFVLDAEGKSGGLLNSIKSWFRDVFF